MQLQHVPFEGPRIIEAYGDMGFRLAGHRHEGSIMLLPHSIVDLPVSDHAQFTVDLFECVFAPGENVEIMILGTGKTYKTPASEIIQSFVEHKTGLEAMDSGAACRTYNILVSEGRRVAAAILAV